MILSMLSPFNDPFNAFILSMRAQGAVPFLNGEYLMPCSSDLPPLTFTIQGVVRKQPDSTARQEAGLTAVQCCITVFDKEQPVRSAGDI